MRPCLAKGLEQWAISLRSMSTDNGSPQPANVQVTGGTGSLVGGLARAAGQACSSQDPQLVAQPAQPPQLAQLAALS